MCGFIGHIGSSYNDFSKAIASIAHRGPDASGNYISNEISLGHTRLSIRDLTSAGDQPMVSACGNYVIAFNGEIYNFHEIKKELIHKYAFNSGTDTEVALYAIVEFGIEKALQKFNGMFALAFYDKRQKKLYLARDRVGIKPLYFYTKNNNFVFASELKAIKVLAGKELDLCSNSLALYLQYGYVPSPYAIYKDTYKLLPGHYLELDISSNNYATHSFWELKSAVLQQKIINSYDQCLDEVENLLYSSINYRLISDVEVGVFLSGGIDSSLVTAIMKQSLPNLSTFTIGFNEKEFDEAPKARIVANHLNTNHHEFFCKSEQVLESIHLIPDIYDEPYADSSAIPTILLSEMTKKHLKVVLSGDGGDELFAGYDKYMLWSKMQKLLCVPGFLRSAACFSLLPLLKYKHPKHVSKICAALSATNSIGLFQAASKTLQHSEVSKLLKVPIFEHVPGLMFTGKDFLNNFSEFDLKYFLEGDVLAKADRATMYASIEAREPLLDYRLVELSFAIPSHLKILHGQKSILKDVAAKYLPRPIIDAPKRGFCIPLDLWLKNDLKHMVEHYFSPSFVNKMDIFNAEYLNQLKLGFFANKVHANKIWHLLMFFMWFERVYQRPMPA